MPTFETDRADLLFSATPISNAFISEYMPAAPEGYVKVYLYGLMCARSGAAQEGDLLEDAARALAMPRAEAERALRYWERCRLVERVRDNPPSYRYKSVQQAMVQRRQYPEDAAYEDFAQAVYAAFGERRKLHGGETVLAYEWVEQLKLPPEVVLMLIQHMIATRGVNFSFKAAQRLAVELSEQRVFTIEDAESVFARSEAATRGARRVLNHLGMRRSPTMDEVDLYQKWTEQWGFTPDAVERACGETTKGSPNFAYLDKVLEGMRARSGGSATTAAQVARQREREDEEAARAREVLAALGISRQRVDEGVRAVYRELAAVGGHEVAVLAAREVSRSRTAHTLDNVAALLESWRARGLTTPNAVRAHLSEVQALNARLRELMALAGRTSGGCTQANRDLLMKWRGEWAMPEDVISLAAELARGMDKPMMYADKLLEGWRAAGAATVEAARAEHERFVRERGAGDARGAGSGAGAGSVKRVIEQEYQQREYAAGAFDGLSPQQLEALAGEEKRGE